MQVEFYSIEKNKLGKKRIVINSKDNIVSTERLPTVDTGYVLLS